MARTSGPPARGERVPWRLLPLPVRRAVEERLGARVRTARTQPSGFSPGMASRLLLSNGRRVFVKAVSSEANADAPRIYRSEARIAAALPSRVPAPRFLWSLETGAWVALAFEDLEGRNPRLPWRREELQRALATLTLLARRGTPSPIRLPSILERHRRTFGHWRTLETGNGSGAGGRVAPRQLGGWVEDHLEELRSLEAGWERGARGATLLHSDYRADNLLIVGGRVFVLDWPWACIGVRWFDLLTFLPSVAMQGGPPPWELFDAHPLAQGVRSRDVDALLAALAGYFLTSGKRPDPPGLSTVRPFQWAQGVEALRWLRYRLEGRDPSAARALARSR